MIYSYLFEAKSIQAYLFQSGKLKDVIAASERLDRMVDTTESSLVGQVLRALSLTHDLTKPAANLGDVDISFLRCKGGALYAGATNKDHLVQFRQLWTLTIQQLFPSLVFTDALCSGETLGQAIEQGHKLLAQDRNLPQITLPYGSAYSAREQRSGKVAVPVSSLAKKAGVDSAEMKGLDADTQLHRQAYGLFELKTVSSLQDRFTPESLRPRHYPVNLDKDFEFDGTKDIALIHIDGNGLGLLLRQLKSAMQGKSDSDYRQAFRQFSDTVNKATELAAQDATAWLAAQFPDATHTLPMRPLVLGGDDVTLLCHAKYALRYAETFCRAFKQHADKELRALSRDYQLSVKLTASGGVLFHKAGHPFVQSHHLVESLCAKAKQLTKSCVPAGQTGPAALACYRVSQVILTDLEQAAQQAHRYPLQQGGTINLIEMAYLVDEKEGGVSWQQLRQLIALCDKAKGTDAKGFTLSRWRKMASELAAGDFVEAKRIFERGLEFLKKGNKAAESEFIEALANLGLQQKRWYRETREGYAAPLVDLLNLAHFEEEISSWQHNNGEVL